jgi:hypothetical protein
VDKMQELVEASDMASRCNAAYAVGMVGLLLGLLLAVTEAIGRGRAMTALPKGILAGLFGGAAGAAGGLAGWYLLYALLPSSHWSPLAKTIVVQGVTLGLLGLGVGLGLALPYRRWRLLLNAALGSVLGAALAAFIYPAATGYFLPQANTEMVVPGCRGGLLPWLLLSTGLIGLVATGLGKPRTTKPSPAPAK